MSYTPTSYYDFVAIGYTPSGGFDFTIGDLNNIVVLPAAGLTLTGNNPTAVTTENNFATLPTAGLTLTGIAPLISNLDAVYLPAAGLILTGYPPSISNVDSTPVSYATIEAQHNLAAGYIAVEDVINSQHDLGAYQYGYVIGTEQYNLYAYTHYVHHLTATHNLYAYTDVAITDVINAQHNLAVWEYYKTGIDGQYALNAYSPVTDIIDAQHDLYAYQAVQVSINAQHHLNAYTYYLTEVDAQHDLNAYEKAIAWIEEHYNLDAYTTFSGWIINRDTKAVSRYEGFNFNSLSGEFGAMDDGIYEITGTTNNGAAINAFIQTGRLNFGSDYLKRVTDAYVDCSSSGDMTLTLNAEGEDTPYTMTPESTVNTVKTDTARGPKDKYWQATLSNVEGSNFTIEALELLEQKLSRKV